MQAGELQQQILYLSPFITNTHLKWSYTNKACASVPFSMLFLTVHSMRVCINSSTEGGGHVLLKVHVQGTTCILYSTSLYSSPPSKLSIIFFKFREARPSCRISFSLLTEVHNKLRETFYIWRWTRTVVKFCNCNSVTPFIFRVWDCGVLGDAREFDTGRCDYIKKCFEDTWSHKHHFICFLYPFLSSLYLTGKLTHTHIHATIGI